MFSAIKEMHAVRNGKPYRAVRFKGSPYCLEVTETDGGKTVYCFGAPIVDHAGQPVRRQFTDPGNGRGLYFYANGGKVTVGDRDTDDIILENHLGQCRLTLPAVAPLQADGTLRDSLLSLRPTYGGVCARVACRAGEVYRCTVRAKTLCPSAKRDGNSLAVAANGQVFAVLSCIGAGDAAGKLLSHAEMQMREIGADTWEIALSHTDADAAYLLFSLNLQGERLLRDTVTESRGKTRSSVYGDAAFLGCVGTRGKTRLYTELNRSVLGHLIGQPFSRAILHLPIAGGGKTPISLYRVESADSTERCRRCGRPSAYVEQPLLSRDRDRCRFDVTELMADPSSGVLRPTGGWIVRAAPNSDGFCAVATGNNCNTPPVLEIRMK